MSVRLPKGPPKVAPVTKVTYCEQCKRHSVSEYESGLKHCIIHEPMDVSADGRIIKTARELPDVRL